MNENILIKQAEKFLQTLGVAFIKPAEIGKVENDRVEIIFLKPETLDPNIVIDPPDVRVWVDKKTGKVEWIPQM